jgi:hypothetical protein
MGGEELYQRKIAIRESLAAKQTSRIDSACLGVPEDGEGIFYFSQGTIVLRIQSQIPQLR